MDTVFAHKKYPLITGNYYINDEGETGFLEKVDLDPSRNDAEIIINTEHKGRIYRLNYATFTHYWKLFK